MRIRLTLIAVSFSLFAYAQAPLIQSVSPVNTQTQGQVIITGSGFSSTTSQLAVYFDNIRANIVSSSNFSIQVDVPPQARMSNVEVINLTTGLSGKSQLKFIQSFGGAAFDPARVSAPVTFPASHELFDICTCDFDLDGKPDLGATKFSNVDDPLTSDLVILKNGSTPGSMSFTQFDKTNLPALNVSFPTINMNCGDLDGDGKPDLVATRTGATKNVVFVLRNTNSVAGTLSFGAVQSLFLDAGQIAFRVSIRDLNLDGKPELIVSNSNDDPAGDNVVYIFVNQSTPGNISFNATPAKITVTGANTTYGLDVQEIDGDGKPDIIVNQFNANDIFVLRNTSTNLISFAAPVKIAINGVFSNVGTADLNQDGLLDMMLTSTIANSLVVFINQSTTGSISFKTPSTFTTTTQPWGVDASDIDGDNDVDIIVATKQANFINVFVSDGAASPSFTRSDIATAKFPRNLKVGDLDGDAKPDFAFTSAAAVAGPFSLDILRNTNCVSPKILNPAPLSICSPQTIILQTTPALGTVTFDWKKGGVSFGGSAPTASISTADSYTVTVTGEGGACTITSPVFTVTPSPGVPPSDPSIGSNAPVCVGGTLNLSTAAVGGIVYQWSGPAGFTSSAQNPTIPNLTPANAGLYKLQLIAGACKSNEVSQNIDVAGFPSFILGSNTPLPACVSPGITLSINSVLGYTYQWLKNSVLTGQTGLSIPVTVEGDYSVLATNTALGCSVETPKTTVQLYTVPVAGFTMPATGCTNAPVSFTNTATVDPRGTAAFAWTFGDAGTASVASPTHTYAAAGSKNVTQTVSYAGVAGCSNPSTQPINIINGTVPVITAPSTQSCPGESVVLSVAGTFNSFTWSTGGTGSALTVTQPGSYTVVTLDANNCSGTSLPYVLNSKVVPALTITATPATVSQGQTSQLSAAGADAYVWSPTATLDNASIANPIASPLATTTYKVTGTLTAGCSAVDSVKVTVSDANTIPAPLIFTPNGDADNDLWKIPGTETLTECTMTIYDGHGSSVYEQKGYKSDWDGTSNGRQLPEAVYFYVFSCPDKKPITGTVMIKR